VRIFPYWMGVSATDFASVLCIVLSGWYPGSPYRCVRVPWAAVLEFLVLARDQDGRVGDSSGDLRMGTGLRAMVLVVEKATV
jgi:hypothetical protein